MDCIVKSARLNSVLDAIKSLLADPTTGVKSYDDVVTYFKENVPEITELEIAQSLVPLNDLQRNGMKDTLKTTQTRLRKLSNAADRLNNILNGVSKRKKTKIPPPDEVDEINQLIKDIDSLASVDSKGISPEAYTNIVARLENLQIYYNNFFRQGDVDISKENIESAIRQIQEIKKAARIDRIDSRIKEIDEQIAGLEDEDLDYSTIENLDMRLRFDSLDSEIAKKENELIIRRNDLQMRLQKMNRQRIAQQGVLGFKNKSAQNVREGLLFLKESLWEPFRAIKFMGDISAWGVQAAPAVYSMLTDVNLNALMKGDIGDAFASQKMLGKMFWQTTIQVIHDGVKNRRAKDGFRNGDSIFAQKLLNELKSRPEYPLARKAGLRISEARSLNHSEEIFTSNLVNKIPVLGLMKDISEDTMVSTLNAIRMYKFGLWHQANPNATLEESMKVAEVINKMTGTTNDAPQIANGLSYIYSAPKLFIARLKLATSVPLYALSTIDLKQSTKDKKLKLQTKADAFIFNELMKSVAGYTATAVLLSALAGVDFEEDPAESNFLRYRVGDTAIDATGGMGTIYRTILKFAHFTFGVRPGASYTTKEKLRYMKSVQRKDGMDALLKGFVEYKLHPTFSSVGQIMTGRDFFGKSFEILGDGEVATRMEASIRSFLPISIEQAVDDIYDITKGEGTIPESLANSTLQMVGFNTFQYGSKIQDVRIQNYYNEVGYTPRPSYPSSITNLKDSRQKEYLRGEYKKAWEDQLGDAILSYGSSVDSLSEKQLRKLNVKIRNRVTREFVREYRDEIRKLEKAED